MKLSPLNINEFLFWQYTDEKHTISNMSMLLHIFNLVITSNFLVHFYDSVYNNGQCWAICIGQDFKTLTYHSVAIY